MSTSSPGFPGFPTVTGAVRKSNDVWAADLRLLFELAHERFGDVCWDAVEGFENGAEGVMIEKGRVWGHKAIVYARAPKAFKDRYFPPTSFNRPFASPSPIGGSPYGDAQQPAQSSSSLLPPVANSSYFKNSNRSNSALSSVSDVGTVRASQYGPDGTLKLTHGGTPEMFRAQLEWLYTSEGMGDVVEWISDQDDVGLGFLGPSEVFTGSLRDSRGRKGGLDDRREKLGQDLTYMWRSKLYADVQIHLVTNDPKPRPPRPSDSSASLPDDSEYDSSSSTASLSNTASFSSHRFILSSRSPYFASVLLNKSEFRPRKRKGSSTAINTVEVITLPSPPFTPAALHFCLGYLYNGSLSFSNRTFDLTTAFQIHRCATYLQLDALRDEIEARIVWDFCHGLDHARCDCRRCAARAPRVWRFACAPDVAAIKLGLLARDWVVKGWGDCWGKEVGEISQVERESLVHDVLQDIRPRSVISVFRGLLKTRRRLEARALTAGGSPDWEVNLEKMLEAFEVRALSTVISHFREVADSAEMMELLNEKSFDVDVLGTILEVVETKVGRPEWCGEIGKVYETLVSSLLLREDPQTKQTVLKMGSKTRQMVEDTREAVIAHIKRRWMLARDQNAFVQLENWALKEISDEIEVSVEDLVVVSSSVPRPRTKPYPSVTHTTPPRLRASASSRSDSQASDASSLRSVATSRSRVSLAPSQISSTSTLRLHSSPPRADASSKTASIASRLAQAPNAVASSSRLRAVTTPTPTSNNRDMTTASTKGKGRASESAAAPLASTSKVAISPAAAVSTPANGTHTERKAPASDAVSVRSTATSRARASSVSSTRTAATSVSTARKLRTPGSALPRSSSTIKPPTLAQGRSSVQPTQPAAVSPRSPNTRPPSVKSMAPAAASKSTAKPSIPRPPSARSIKQPMAGPVKAHQSATPQTPKSPAASKPQPQVSGTSSMPPKRPSSVNSVRSTKSTRSTTSTVHKANGVTVPAQPTPPMPKNARTAIATHRSPSTASLTASPSGLPRQRAVSNNSKLSTVPSNVTAPVTKVSAVTAARLRTASLVSNASASKPRPLGLSDSHRAPAASRSKVSAVASQFGGQPSVRSPSGSTDNTEMQTPTIAEARLEPPTIIRTTSTGSELADLATELELVSVAPVMPKISQELAPSPIITSPPFRPVRTNSNASVASTTSVRPKYHPAAAFDPPKTEQSLPLPTVRVDDGLKPLPTNHGVALDVGIPCIVSLQKKRARFKAFARYIGRVEGCRGAWVGVEVDEASREKFGLETSDGSRDGTRYFHLSLPNVGDVSDPLERAGRRRKIESISNDLIETGLTKSRMAGLGLGTSLFHQANSPNRSPRGSLTRSSSPYGDRMSTDPWGQNWLGEAQPRGLFVRPSEVVFVEGAE